MSGPSPAHVLDLDLDLGLDPPPLPEKAPDGRIYRRGVVLARSGGRPVTLISFDRAAGDNGAGIAQAVRARLSPDVVSEVLTGPPALPPVKATLMPVTVVIATRRRPAQLDQCLASLAACDHPQFEVIVVDNGPSEETRVGRSRPRHPTRPRGAIRDRTPARCVPSP